MSTPKLRRFYREAVLQPAENGFSLLLDGKPLRTPEKNSLVLPNAPLGDALAKEWNAAGEYLDSQIMPYTKLAFTAVDRVGPHREAVIEQVSAYANSDVVCYRATSPSDLVERQKEDWDPVLVWAESQFDVAIQTVAGISHVAQEHDTLSALTSAFSVKSDFYLAALYSLVANGNSLILALAVAIGGKNPDEAFRSANCEELYQWEKWGRDAEAEARLEERAGEFQAAAAFIKLLNEGSE